jgi:hypothetical protein
LAFSMLQRRPRLGERSGGGWSDMAVQARGPVTAPTGRSGPARSSRRGSSTC